MHWTALVARRHLAPHVQVVEDLACIGCGYNLRGLLASGACPECGLQVGGSLFRLRKPDETAAALRAVGRTFLAPAMLLLVPLAGMFGSIGLLWIALGGLALGSLLRVAATSELRFRCGIERLPVLDTRVTLLLWVSIFDALLACATLVLYYLALSTVAPVQPTMDAAFGWTLAAWVSFIVIDALVAGSFGVALARLLEWEFVAREFRRQRFSMALGVCVAVLAALIAAAVQASGGSARAGTTIVGIGLGLVVLAAAIGMIFTVVAYLHLGSAAERERDRREDVLAGPEEDMAAPAPARQAEPAAEPPDIPLG